MRLRLSHPTRPDGKQLDAPVFWTDKAERLVTSSGLATAPGVPPLWVLVVGGAIELRRLTVQNIPSGHLGVRAAPPTRSA
jgi:hypothetical protein